MLPLLVKDFEWRQNSNWLYLTVQIKGIKSSKTHITTSPHYLRVHYPPYFFELFLNGPIDDENSKVTISELDDSVNFELAKGVPGGSDWAKIGHECLTQEEKKEIRNKAVELGQQRYQKSKQDQQEARQSQRQMTIEEQIRLECEQKRQLDEKKKSQIEDFLAHHHQITTSNIGEISEDSSENEKFETEKFVNQNDNNCGGREIDEIEAGGPVLYHQSQNHVENSNLKVDEKTQIPIRPCCTIPVQFSARNFPTPARESTRDKEEEWLRKQAEARKKSGWISPEDLKDEEKDPNWLLEKGRSLLTSGSYLGALSAFSLGSKLAPKMPEFSIGLAEAQLELGNHKSAAENASKALDQLTPKVLENSGDRKKSHILRGRAFKNLGLCTESQMDFQAALQIDPSDPEILQEIEKIEKILEKSMD